MGDSDWKNRQDLNERGERIRLDIHSYFVKIAHLVAERSTCIKRQVGAVLVRDGQILSTGYNGPPSGFTHCTPEICPRYESESGERLMDCYAVHAEANCIIQAALHGTAISGNTTIYTTTFPCTACVKLLLNASVKKIVYEEGYDLENPIKKRLIEESGVEIYHYHDGQTERLR